MVDIVVVRDNGDIDGGIVENQMIIDITLALRLGQTLIDRESIGRDYTIKIGFRLGLEQGSLVKVVDDYEGVPWVGRIKSIGYQQEDGFPIITLIVRRPMDA